MNQTNDNNSLDISDRFKLEKLLEETYKCNWYHEKYFVDNMWIHQFSGKIGNKINFDGKFFDPTRSNAKKSWVEIDYHNQTQKLAKVTTEHGFIAQGSMPFWTDGKGLVWDVDWLNNNIKPIADTTKIKVFSPRYNEKDGMSETFYNEDKQRQLSVYHAPKENAKTVLANIFRAVTFSKDHVAVKEKLKQLNLPSDIKIKNLDALADSVTNQIYNEHQSDHEM